jgi:hypothetical protein
MPDHETLYYIARHFALQTPWCVALFVGLVVAIVRRRHCRRPANRAIAGLAVMGSDLLLMPPAHFLLSQYLLMTLGLAPDAVDLAFSVLSGVSSLAMAVGVALLLSAAFVDRPPAPAGG